MKIKQLTVIISIAATTIPAMAQYEGTRVYDRIGSGEDSVATLRNLALYADCYKAGDFDGAYEPWKEVFTKAPMAQVSTYTYGAAILANLILKAQDTTKKKGYFDELLAIYDTRIKNLDALNSFTKENKRATKGDILARKAFDYAHYGPGVDPEFSLEKAYSFFREGIDMINTNGAKEVEGFVLDKFFDISYQKFQANKDGFREQFLKDYLESREACEKMLSLANEAEDTIAAQKIVSQYDPTLNRIETLFAQSKAADKTQIIAIFGPKIEENKTNLAYLKNALMIMAANDCDDTDAYFKAAQYAYQIEPTYESAIGTAQKYAKDGKAAESIQYYDKALELCPTDVAKANIAMKIASALAKTGSMEKAYSYLTKATEYNKEITGRSYLLRAQFLAVEKKYGDAIAHCNKAIAEDISISGSANRLKTNIVEIQRKQSEYDKANAAYQEEKAKREKEENFWKGKK